MEKRVIIFGVCLDRGLDIFEYGDSVNYKKLCEKDLDKEYDLDDEEKLMEVNGNGGSWYVRGCSGLMSYYWCLDWFRDEIEEFRFNIIKYKSMDVDWDDYDEERFVNNFFNDYNIDYNEYVKEVKKFLGEVEEEDSWRKILNNNYVMEDL